MVSEDTTDVDALKQIYNYVVNNLTYDYDKAEAVETGYLPDVDETLSTKTGICFDYAALTTAMLRSCDIPCKLHIGYTGDIKHAWIDVYIRSKGWVNNAVSFKGNSWSLMDPTFDSNSDDKEAIQACIRTAHQIDREHVRIVRIKNTLHIGEIMLSEAYYEDVKNGKYPGVTALDEPQELEFDEQGALLTQI